jgi:hypothetical protein
MHSWYLTKGTPLVTCLEFFPYAPIVYINWNLYVSNLLKFQIVQDLRVVLIKKIQVQILPWNLKGLTNWDCLKVPNLVPPKNTSTPQLEQAAVAAAEHDSKLIIKSHKREHVQVRIRYISIITSSFTLLRNFKRCNLIIQNFEPKFEWCRKIKTTFKKFCKTFK